MLQPVTAAPVEASRSPDGAVLDVGCSAVVPAAGWACSPRVGVRSPGPAEVGAGAAAVLAEAEGMPEPPASGVTGAEGVAEAVAEGEGVLAPEGVAVADGVLDAEGVARGDGVADGVAEALGDGVAVAEGVGCGPVGVVADGEGLALGAGTLSGAVSARVAV